MKSHTHIRPVERVLPPVAPHMVGDGFRVHNFFPSGHRIGYKRMSPFFLMDYNSLVDFSPSERPRGVSVHPHRGFETVTIAFQGRIAHHDSTGNSGVIGEGDVQWMTAGSGILHKEYHEESFSRAGGPFHMVQLWVNLPAKDKMTSPTYQAITHEQMGVHPLPDEQGQVRVIAGNYQGTAGPAHTFTPIEMYVIELAAGGEVELSLPDTYNAGILVAEGSVEVNGAQSAPTDHFILFKNEGTDIHLRAGEPTKLLVLGGEPIDEPIAAYGPFLMNTNEELQQALADFNQGKFGVLAD